MPLIDGSNSCGTLVGSVTKKEYPTTDIRAEGSSITTRLGRLKSWEKWEKSIAKPQSWISGE